MRTYGLYNGKAAVSLQVVQQPGANIIEVVDAVRAELDQLRTEIDPKIDLEVISDRSITIRASLRQVERALLLSVAMVILVVYLFLNSVRSALVPAVVVPVSLIGTFSAMYLLGYSLNNFTLMALTIATGFVVDDAIVVMENTTRHIEGGMGRLQAALLGAKQVGFTVLSMSLSLVAVFIPFEFAGGIIGRLFREFTNTLSVAILLSLVMSLTATPMLCAKLLGRGRREAPRGFAGAFNRQFESLRGGYQRTLAWALDHRRTMIAVLLASIGLNVYLYIAVPKGLFPQQDTGMLQGGVRGDAFASFDSMKGKLDEVAAIIQRDPAVASVAGNINGGAFAQLQVTLKPLSERDASADRVIARLRPRLFGVAGVNVFLQAVQDFRGGGGRGANSQYQYTLTGDDLSELRDWSQKLRIALQDVPLISDVDTDQQPGGLESQLVVDRDSATRLGLSTSQIDNTLGAAFTQAQVSNIYNPYSPQQYHVVLGLAPEFLKNPEVLRQIYISTSGGSVSGTQATRGIAGPLRSGGAPDAAANLAANSLANSGRGNTSTGSAVSTSSERMIPLAAFSHFETATTPVTVNHTGTAVSTSISYNLPEGVALNDAIQAIEKAGERIHMPISVHGSAYGTANLFSQSQQSQPLMLLASLVAIYIVLGMLYESYAQPLVIISTLPSAGIGALLALMATGTQFSLIAFLGILLLIGIVKKNAIMMVDVALEIEREERVAPYEAIARACHLRFRPILMTTCAAIAGALPLALAVGDGTELRRPLGVAIVGGLVVSQLLTLYTTPVVYLYVRRLELRRRKLAGKAPDGVLAVS